MQLLLQKCKEAFYGRSTFFCMLARVEYLGHTVNLKTKKQSCKSKRKIRHDHSLISFHPTDFIKRSEAVASLSRMYGSSARKNTTLG